MHNFLLCLQHGYLWRLHHATADKVQRRGLSGSSFVFWQKPTNKPFHLRDKTDEQGSVQNVEAGMKHGQHDGNTCCLSRHGRIVANESAHHVDKGIEHDKHPDDTKHVEQQVGQGCTSCLNARPQGCKIGCCRRSDVLTHHQGDAHTDRQHTSRTEQDGNGHDRS